MMKKFLKSLSLIMALVMCFSMFTVAVSADTETPTPTLTIETVTVEPGAAFTVTVDADAFTGAAGLQGKITIADGLTADVAADCDCAAKIPDTNYIAIAEVGEVEGGLVAFTDGTIFTITGTAPATEGTYALTWADVKVADSDEEWITETVALVNGAVVVEEKKPEHVHEYVDGICSCGEYQYTMTWNTPTYDLAETKLNVAYKVDNPSSLYDFLRTFTATGSKNVRSVDAVLDLGGNIFVFSSDTYVLNTNYVSFPISGFSIADMATDMSISMRINYYVDANGLPTGDKENGTFKQIYTSPLEVNINDLLAETSAGDELYEKYVALTDAIAADTANEEVLVATSDTDAIYEVYYSATNELKFKYKASTDKTTPTRVALAKTGNDDGRDVAVVLVLGGKEFVFKQNAVGGYGYSTAFTTVPVTGFTLLDLSMDMQIFTRIYHYGVNDNYTDYTDSENAAEYNVAAEMVNGTSAVSVALADYLATAYPAE